MPFRCPHCGVFANRRSARSLSEQTKETRYICVCGHEFRAIEQIVNTLSPSGIPNDRVRLDVAIDPLSLLLPFDAEEQM